MAIVAANGGTDFIYVPDRIARHRQAHLRQAGRSALCRRAVRQRRPAQGRRPERFRRRAADERHQPDRLVERAATRHRRRLPLLRREGLQARRTDVHGRDRRHRRCTPARACTAASAAPTRAISWPPSARISKPSSSTRRRSATSTSPRRWRIILGVDLPGPGTLKGRVIAEALKAASCPRWPAGRSSHRPPPMAFRTVLDLEEVGSTRYFDAAGMPGALWGFRRTEFGLFRNPARRGPNPLSPSNADRGNDGGFEGLGGRA